MEQPEAAPDPRALIEEVRRRAEEAIWTPFARSDWERKARGLALKLAAALESALDRAEAAEADAAKARAALAVVVDRFPLNARYRATEAARAAKAEAVRQMLLIPSKSWPDGILHRGAFGRVGAAARDAWGSWDRGNKVAEEPTVAPPPFQLMPEEEARLNSHLGAAIVRAIARIPPEDDAR